MRTIDTPPSDRRRSDALGGVYAHTVPGAPEQAWEPLADHLRNVAELAQTFADAFQSGDWGYITGLWHDLGKYRPEFQARLRGERIHAPHSGVGAALAASRGGLGMAVAFAIAGHHTGLANRAAQGDSDARPLRERIAENAPTLKRLRQLIPRELIDYPLPPPPAYLIPPSRTGRSERESAARRTDFWTRLLFSALIDADRLATEGFYDPAKRRFGRDYDSLPSLRERLEAYLDRFHPDTPVNRIRAEILQACRTRADQPTGIFTLTVPTGGGKTLSSLAFALRHAEKHGLRRVIVVVPYTTILEQNARVYRDALGDHNVIEHHSNIDEAGRLEHDTEAEIRRQLACENWDAPIIVTTNVQFFESLFSNLPSRCRKLHNIVRSVILIDEAQTLPVRFLNSALDAMRELAAHYGCSFVLMTATQPALARRDSLPCGLENSDEIVPDTRGLARALDRVRVHWPDPDAPPVGYDELAARIADHERVLAIVHRRRDARELAQKLPPDHRFHLSALMCPAHRLKTLSVVRDRLSAGKPCRLVATQLVEAGVDIDFPVVYRALAGLDSLAQAAGRCNREGRLMVRGRAEKGDFFVFRAETTPPPGTLLKGLESTEALLGRYGPRLSFTDPDMLEEYFRILYAKCETDPEGVQIERAQFNFANVARKVRLIEDGYSQPVVVPWRDAHKRVRAFESAPSRETQRALQPFLVQISEVDLERLKSLGAVERLRDSVHVLTPSFEHLYHEEWGLVVDEDALPNPEALIG
ncbi:MAG TPA: CRISPR-associated helicase Cas3' [Longimicrobiales bacterium]